MRIAGDLSHDWPQEERYELGSQVRRSSNSLPKSLQGVHPHAQRPRKVPGNALAAVRAAVEYILNAEHGTPEHAHHTTRGNTQTALHTEINFK